MPTPETTSELSWTDFVQKLTDQGQQKLYKGDLLSIDPGGTTGWAFFSGGLLQDAGEYRPKQDNIAEAADFFYQMMRRRHVDCVVMEEYRVYGWKAKHHAWSDLLTSRLIGALEFVSFHCDVPVFKQSAQTAKTFATDEMLQTWKLWIQGQRHARDAIRHGCYYTIFGG